ncbi:MAG: SurA N-terminal domain-containing protein, partial [Blastocatellia bacterium]|nr:SurA N-terminal domain-containing protein [Blastocatellia bacterium]
MKLKSISFSLRAVVMLLAFLTTAVAQEPQIVDEVVARVNSDIITRSALLKAEAEFISQIKQSFPNDEAKQKEEIEKGLSTLIELLIEEKLIAQRAAELSVDVEPDINRTILELIKQTNPNWGLKEFQDYLSQQNIDIEDVRKVYRTQLQRRVLLFREVINPI